MSGKTFIRIASTVALIAIIVTSIISSCVDNYKNSGDTNVYLKEEVCFSDEIFIAVNSLNVMIKDGQKEQQDDDEDILSEYIMNLGIYVEQRHTDFWVNKVKIKPSCFKLKSVNLKAKSKMGVFIECLAKETLSMLLSGAVEGSVNILEETINFIGDYTIASIENAENSDIDFKPIKCDKDSFEPFYPHKIQGKTFVNLSFPIKQEYLESENIIVLAINHIAHLEKRIFLITRPDKIQDKENVFTERIRYVQTQKQENNTR